LSFIPEGSNKVLTSSPESFETFVTDEKNWCIEMKTMVTPNTKLMVRVWPNNAADARPVNIVATVDEYFFNIVSEQEAHSTDQVTGWHSAYNKETAAHSPRSWEV
jgi:hypothetical protein